MRFAFGLLLLAGCDQVFGLESRDAAVVDAFDPDARVCAQGAPFISMSDVPIAGNYSVEAARFNPTQTIGYLSLCGKNQPKSTCDLFQTLYVPATNEFSNFQLLELNSASIYDSYGAVTPDAQYMVFGSERTGSVRTYVSISDAGRFQAATELVLLPSATYVNEPYLLGDGQTLYFAGQRSSGAPRVDIYRARGGPPAFGGSSDLVGGVNGDGGEFAPVVSDDELEIFFSSDRESIGEPGLPLHIFTATRDAKGAAFRTPVRIPSLSTTNSIDWPVWLSPNRCDLYFINKVNNVGTLRLAHR